jgi:hypothetical protein
MENTLRGVNLGGWLVLERWMTPTLFKDTLLALLVIDTFGIAYGIKSCQLVKES